MERQKIRRFIHYFLIILFIVIIASLSIRSSVANSNQELYAVNGELDLRDLKIENEGPIKLDGEWLFHWQELLTPEDIGQRSDLSSFIVSVPDTWKHYHLNEEPLPKHGYATYHLTVLLNEEDVGTIVSLYLHSIATAYRLWVNEELVASNGQVAISREQMIPKNYSKVVSFEVNRPKIELIFQVSNYYHRKSGLWEPITFGTVETISKERENSVLFQMFVIGCIFMIGIYHLMLFFHRSRELSPLYLAIACFGIALRTSVLKDTLLVYLFPTISWELAVNLEYLSALIALLCFLLFVKQEHSLQMSNKITNLFAGVIICYSIFVLISPARIFTSTFPLFQSIVFSTMCTIVIMYIIGILQKRKGSYLNVIALLVLFTAVLNDIFYYSQWISTDELVSVGLLFYLFTQSIHLARKFSRSFDNVEKLSEELQVLNESLEKKVETRTGELRNTNQRLQKVEDSRRRLLSSVSHELKTPLTFIQGYIKAMMDGVVPKDDSTYLRSVYSDTQMMDHIINDLQELSKLESGQVTFQFETVDIRSFLYSLYLEQKPIMEEKGFKFEYKETAHTDVVCYIDPIRLKQVYLNLIVNAQKFTPVGGTITLELEVLSTDLADEIKVSIIDTGSGIAKEALSFIFERFYKINKPRSGTERGAGLGLAIAKEVIEYHNGSIGVKSEEGKGSEFYFTLPIESERGISDEKRESVSRR